LRHGIEGGIKAVKAFGRLRGRKGFAMVMVMGFISLLFITAVSLSTMIARDMRLVDRAIKSEQARSMAEAGINHALARLETDIWAKSSFSGNLASGSYSVAFSKKGTRQLITSTGTVGEVSVVSSAEIKDNIPPPLDYLIVAGNDVKLRSFISAATITGKIHANHDVLLTSGAFFSNLYINGDVYAVHNVLEGDVHYTSDSSDTRVYINGLNRDSAVVYESPTPVMTISPIVNLAVYKQKAIDSGNYTNGNLDVTNRTFTPANGIVYVDGDLTLRGTCTLNGGVVANNIYVIGNLIQNKTGDRNVIYAKSGDIRIYGSMNVGKALMYAWQDIRGPQDSSTLRLTGLMVAKRDVSMWNFLVNMTYTYAPVYLKDMLGEGGGEIVFDVVSWNR
jgi:hypothetical protein